MICITDLVNTQLQIIKKVCKEIGLQYYEDCLNFLDQRNHSLVKIPFQNYIHLHLMKNGYIIYILKSIQK